MVVGGYRKKTFKNNEGNEVEFFEVLLLDSYVKPEKGTKEGCYSEKITLGVKKFNEFRIAECLRNSTPVVLMYDRYRKPIISHE